MPAAADRTTRKQRIDPRLVHAGWPVVLLYAGKSASTYRVDALEEDETSSVPADYTLCAGALTAQVERAFASIEAEMGLDKGGQRGYGIAV